MHKLQSQRKLDHCLPGTGSHWDALRSNACCKEGCRSMMTQCVLACSADGPHAAQQHSPCSSTTQSQHLGTCMVETASAANWQIAAQNYAAVVIKLFWSQCHPHLSYSRLVNLPAERHSDNPGSLLAATHTHTWLHPTSLLLATQKLDKRICTLT